MLGFAFLLFVSLLLAGVLIAGIELPRRVLHQCVPAIPATLGRIVSWAITGVYFGLAALFAFGFYDRFWRWRHEFNELGRYYDAETQQVFHDNSFVLIIPAASFFVAGAFRAIIRLLRKPGS